MNPLGLRFAEPRAERVRPPAHLGPGCRTEVELGCADAKFTFELARAHPDRFYVGLDIREKVIEDNREIAREEGLRNVAFAYVNLGVDLDRVFGAGEVDRFHVLFPDPWFKSRHHKRRVIDAKLCAVMRTQLRAGGELHVATDVWEIAIEALAELEDPAVAELGFRNALGPWSFWRGNPFAASSRREDTTLARGQRVWRMRFLFDGADELG